MLLVCYGTRPEYLKVKPLFKKLKGVLPFKTLFTGQHVDLIEKSISSDYTVSIQPGKIRLNSIVASTIDCIDFKKEGISAVLVQGDTTSAVSIALSAFNQQIPVIHLEAGLRTYNLQHPYPEEANRQIIARISSLNLCPTEHAASQLQKESVAGNIEVVGNTVLDNLVGIKTSNNKKVLVTLHRRENHDKIKKWFEELEKIALLSNLEYIIPLHPNPEVQKYKEMLKNMTVIDPLPHLDLLKILAECSFVITDSGGIQEEAAFLRKPCVVCREETERIEGLNNFSILCNHPNMLASKIDESMLLKLKGNCPYGDGKSSEKIVIVINKFMQNNG